MFYNKLNKAEFSYEYFAYYAQYLLSDIKNQFDPKSDTVCPTLATF